MEGSIHAEISKVRVCARTTLTQVEKPDWQAPWLVKQGPDNGLAYVGWCWPAWLGQANYAFGLGDIWSQDVTFMGQGVCACL